MKIFFVSRNIFKLQEARSILSSTDIEIEPVQIPIEELQTEDTTKLVRDKTLKAFEKIGRPLFVEHTGLYLKYLNGMPGGLTQIFWDNLQEELFSNAFGKLVNTEATAKTVIGYCDGRKIHHFEGEIQGHISPSPRGPRGFQWDCVFIPAGYDKTFAELGETKNTISMRKIALDEFSKYLSSQRGV